jgi:TolB protein
MSRLLALLSLTTAAGFTFIALIGQARSDDKSADQSTDLRSELKSYPHKIVHESNRDGNWELYLMNAGGSNPVNITNTPDVDELYPKPSPDGSKIAFVADTGKADARLRSVYYMNSDGSNRVKVADHGREQCWSPDGKEIAYMKDEFENFSFHDGATKGLYIYNLQTGKTRQHPNKRIEHLYTLNWSPDKKWFVATVHGGMGFSHGILAIEADGDRVIDLKLDGCRPNLRYDGKKVCWGHGDFCAGVADLDLTSTPKATNIHNVVENKDPIETYHITWSPDGKYITYSRGPKFMKKNLKGLVPEYPGVEAPGWDICVADVNQRNRWVALTTNGKSNKQPNWVKVKEKAE